VEYIAIGLYGVTSYMVARRRGEIGIRMALGASRSSVMRLILKEAGLLVSLGLLVGAALAIAASRPILPTLRWRYCSWHSSQCWPALFQRGAHPERNP
jgi:ABC-type antimicrobial peptide transport system permease subunit